MDLLPIHFVIPDTQVKPGVPLDHLDWIGQYLVDHFAGYPDLKVIHLGDHWDLPSLSSYDRKGGTLMEGRRLSDDIEAGNEGIRRLNAPLEKYNRRRSADKQWHPKKYLLRGNHEDRLQRAIDDDAQMEGVLTMDLLESPGWTVVDFLKPLFLDGIGYSHYWTNHMTGKPLGGMPETQLKNVGHSFTQGHVQTLKAAVLDRMDPETGRPTRHRALIAGACYLHDEDYKGHQGNGHWRGIVVKHAVHRGNYNMMEVDLDYLARRYTKHSNVDGYLKEIGYESL